MQIKWSKRAIKLIYYIDLSQNILYIVDLWDTRREPSQLIVTPHE